MKPIFKIAIDEIPDAFDPDEILPVRAGYLVNLERRGFIDGANWMKKELLRWRDPENEAPEENISVVLKTLDINGNEAIYLGERVGDGYFVDGGLIIGYDFDHNYDDIRKVIGWRPIEE